MDTPLRYSTSATVILTRVALAVFAASVIVAEVITVISAQSLAENYPEFAHLHGPLVGAAIAFGICVEVILLITGILVGYTRDHRIFGPHARRLVDVLTGTTAVATIIVGATLFVVPGPPALGLLLLGSALVGSTLTLVLLVLRSLLGGAASMRVELDEVV